MRLAAEPRGVIFFLHSSKSLLHLIPSRFPRWWNHRFSPDRSSVALRSARGRHQTTRGFHDRSRFETRGIWEAPADPQTTVHRRQAVSASTHRNPDVHLARVLVVLHHRAVLLLRGPFEAVLHPGAATRHAAPSHAADASHFVNGVRLRLRVHRAEHHCSLYEQPGRRPSVPNQARYATRSARRRGIPIEVPAGRLPQRHPGNLQRYAGQPQTTGGNGCRAGLCPRGNDRRSRGAEAAPPRVPPEERGQRRPGYPRSGSRRATAGEHSGLLKPFYLEPLRGRKISGVIPAFAGHDSYHPGKTVSTARRQSREFLKSSVRTSPATGF